MAELPGVFHNGYTCDATNDSRIATITHGAENILYIYHRQTMNLWSWQSPPEPLSTIAAVTAEWAIVVGHTQLWLVFHALPVIVSASIWSHNDPAIAVWGRADPHVPSAFNAVVHCCHFSGVVVVTTVVVARPSVTISNS